MAEAGDIRVNGTVYDPNTMTFREQREMRNIIRDKLYDGVLPDEDELGLADILPAMAFVLHRRDNADYTLDEALDLVANDVVVTEEEAKPKRPPTKRKTSAASGSPA